MSATVTGAGTCPYSHALHWNEDHSKRWCQGCLEYYPLEGESMNQTRTRTVDNQTVLGNGCVCTHGCEACDALAEAFEAMREALRNVISDLGRTGEAYDGGEPHCVHRARAALALADKVSSHAAD